MTSDAKIGLLLGLVLIFVIAFVINGLPDFSADGDSNELTYTMVQKQLGIADREREITKRVVRPAPPAQMPDEQVLPAAPHEEQIRFIAPLPASTNPLAGSPVPGPTDVQTIPDTGPQRAQVAANAAERPRLPVSYTVQTGDILPVIAKKFYGPEEGNKRANINRIFEANRKVLQSPDKVFVGQKLTIPPLPASAATDPAANSTFASRVFERVQSIGQKRLSGDDLKKESARDYVVREKDNLWKIAASQLGDGKRYMEIRKLNSALLADGDSISVGQRLKLPVR